jgi:hypothetical protein
VCEGLTGQGVLNRIGTLRRRTKQGVLGCGIADRTEAIRDVLSTLEGAERGRIGRPLQHETRAQRIGKGKGTLFTGGIAIEQGKGGAVLVIDVVKYGCWCMHRS